MWFIFFCVHLSRARVGVKITFLKITCFQTQSQHWHRLNRSLKKKKKGKCIFMMHSRNLQRENLKKSRIFFHPLKFLFVESEIHCFSPYFPCTQSAMGLETAVCIGEYLNLNKNIMATKRKTDSSFPPALMLCKILVTSSPQTKYWVQFDLSHDLPPPGDTF